MFAALRTQFLSLMSPQTEATALPLPAFTGKSFVKQAALVIAATLLLALSAKFKVPFYPVPMTLQSLVVLLIGAFCGARLSAVILTAYLFEGVLGLPVFAGNTPAFGFAYLLGPTGGYLLGFLLAAPCVGLAAERGFVRGFWRAFVTMSLGHGVVYLCGFLWLAMLLGAGKAFAFGVVPFIAPAIVSTILAALIPQLRFVKFSAKS